MRRLVFFVLGLLFITAQLYAQNKTISGRVADAQGAPVGNASVIVKGSNPTVGTATDADGKFSLSIPSDAKTLVISSVGFEPKEVSIGKNSNFSVSMTAAADGGVMTEVVVQVPYGTVKKKQFTGAENTIGAPQIVKQQVTNVQRALEGLVPGIMTTNGGGTPGGGASIVIRGFSSINGQQEPLYVLNGVPYDGSISAISNDDIESITILKDAAAASLYGSRAAAGVIMITTKTGKKGKPAVSATVRQGWMVRGIPEYDRVGPKDYYELHWESTRNAFMASGLTRAQAGINASNQLTDASHLVYNAYNVPGNKLVDSVTGLLNPNAQLLWNESWEDALFHTAPRTNANVNISGANDKSNYYVSFGYLSEDGTEKHSNYKRYNIRMNVNTDATNWFTTGANVDGAYTQSSGVINGGTATSNPFYYSHNMGPIYPVYQHNLTTGAVVLDSLGNPALDWGTPQQMGARPYAANSNLVGSLALDDRSSQNFNGNANAYGEVKFLKQFSFKTNFGLNLFENYSTTYQNSQFGDAQNVQGRLTKSFGRNISYTLNQILTWNKKFEGVHNVRAILGHENYQYTSTGMSATKTGFLYPNAIELNSGGVTEGDPTGNTDKQTIESYFFNANYDYKGKYLASFSARRDGSSRFIDSLRWGTFYSGGLGWIISDEEFLKNVNWLNTLKLRASYGEVGQDDIGLFYPYADWYYGDGTGAFTRSNTKPNPEIKWEKNKKFNVGVDFTMFKNRLQGTIEYFNNVSSDLLFLVPLPPSTSGGRSNQWQNIGESKNTGVELSLGYNVIRKKNFDWRVDVNMTHLKNEVTKIPPTQKAKGGIVSGTKKIMEGHSIYDFWMYEFAGVDAASGDALYYQDVLDSVSKPTGQRIITNDITKASKYYFGTAIPDFNGGITNAFRYKNFDLSFLVTFAYGGQFYDGNYASIMSASSYGTALHTDILNRWRNPGDVTNVPRLQNGNAGTQEGASSRFLFDGSYLNVKNVTLQYTFSKTMTNKMHVAGLNLFANIDNLHLFTAKKGMDPQRSFAGTSDATYPPFRTYTIGLNLNL